MPGDNSIDEEKAMAEIVERLREKFPDSSTETIESAVQRSRSSFDEARVRDFVPVLIEKEAKAILKGKR